MPERVAKILTYPERVTVHNLARLRSAVLNGCDTWPGANYVNNQGAGSFKRFLKFGKRDVVAQGLRLGDVVERHLIDGEYVMCVHCMSGSADGADVVWCSSIVNPVCTNCLSCRIESKSGRGGRSDSTNLFAIRKHALTYEYCDSLLRYSYNADFDGDEMNLREQSPCSPMTGCL